MILRDVRVCFGTTLKEGRIKVYVVGRKQSSRATSNLWIEAGGGAKIGSLAGFRSQPRDGFSTPEEAKTFATHLFPDYRPIQRFLSESNDLHPHYFSDPETPKIDLEKPILRFDGQGIAPEIRAF